MAQPIVMPDLGSGMEEGTLLNWTKQVGDTIKEGDVIAEIETDKTTVEVPSPVAGTITQLIGDLGTMLRVGATIGFVGAAGEAAAPAPAAPAAAPAPAAEAAPAAASNGAAAKPAEVPAPAAAVDEEEGNLPDGVRASPVARKIAESRGINLKLVKGTGPSGRVTKADVEAYVPAAAAPAPAAAAAPAGLPAASYGNLPSGLDVEIIETSKIRSRIAARMVESKQQIPHFYTTTVVDVEPMMALRKQINADLDDSKKVSVNDLIVKATALALRQFPNLNSHFYGDKIVRHKRIHIGIAVALPNGGLMNVVAKDADKVSLGTLSQLNKEMIARAREGKVKPDDVQGSTFTVSNLGGYDVENFQAIVNPPEAGILAVSSALKVPVVKADGTLGVGQRMKLTVSVDHRVSDGAEGAQFAQALKKLIENPMALLL
ncbi:MAG: 2-oxo acid dehydrogenase subunit E2 [Pleurocapsa minor GSE-CHR-MK-17-07R]|jgi:pyruvate dehydrogenase E2 component (dihydrolipoamide acetyltransferase)|nr:2-oxo acid dehydrogenase subunit E2 [Pleurocapsa minor GSE-CHR-MK 17-07R]